MCVHAKRQAISLDKNEGIYVRNLKTGEVSSRYVTLWIATFEIVSATTSLGNIISTYLFGAQLVDTDFTILKDQVRLSKY